MGRYQIALSKKMICSHLNLQKIPQAAVCRRILGVQEPKQRYLIGATAVAQAKHNGGVD